MTRPDLRERYRQALGAWLERDDAGQDFDPLGFGREALAGGRGLIELMSIHQSLVAPFVAKLPSPADIARCLARADLFMTEMAAPYEMTHRGWHDVANRLQRLNATLELQVAERTAELAASELRSRDIAEVSADWIWDTDREHRLTNFVGASPAALSMSSAYSIGKTRWDAVGADPVSDVHWAMHKAELDAHLSFRNFRYWLPSGAGTRIYITVSGKPVFDAGGAFVGYRGAATNETRMIEAVHRAEKAEATLRDALANISGGFAIYDADDRIVLCNPHMHQIYPDCADLLEPGMTFEAFIRETVVKGYCPEATGCEEAFIARRMATHRAGSGSFEYRLKDRWALIHERRMSNGGIVSIGLDITALKTAQLALAASEARLDRAQEIAHIGSWEEDLTTEVIVWSQEMYRIRGEEPGIARTLPAVLALRIDTEDTPTVIGWFADLKRGIARAPIEVRLCRPDGEMRIVSYDGRPVADAAGRITGIAGTLEDVTVRKLVERQLVQAQKMEAIGNLTGGMAHDFNNLLGVIVGNLDLLRELAKDAPAIDELAKESLDAALRGADVTRRLLAFARRQPLYPERGDVNSLIATTVHLLRRTLGDTIERVLDLAPDLWPVVVDPAQLEAALTNLATNARDAMPQGGRIAVTTRNAHLDEAYAKRHLDVTQGDYVVIEFSDSGAGMSADIASRIFEPFFTTKEPGKGTGLGLAMVFGFMRQSGGHIDVESKPGVGTIFRLYLPRDTSDAAPPRRAAPLAVATRSGETILVVEDNEKLRAVVVKQLTELGYRVLAADGAPAALRLLAQPAPIALLLTDIVMPGGMDGIELAQSAVALRPPLKVLLTSGFPQTRIGEDAIRVSGRRLLSKPYRRDALARLVRETLDEQAAEPLPEPAGGG